MRARITLCAALIVALSAGSGAARTPGVNAPFPVGTAMGSASIDVSSGAWSTFTSDEFTNATGAAPAALSDGQVLVNLVIENTHATGVLYLVLAPSASGAVTERIAIQAGNAYAVPLYGLNVTGISLQGSTANVTGVAIAHFLPAGG